MSDIRIFKLTYTTPTTYGLPQVCINDENNNAEFVDFDEATNSPIIKQNTEIIFEYSYAYPWGPFKQFRLFKEGTFLELSGDMYWGGDMENEEHPATDRIIFTDVEIASKVQKFINENKTSVDSLHSILDNVHFLGGGRECIKFGAKKILGCFMFNTLKSLDINDIDSDINLYKELNILHSMFITVKNIINEKYKDFSFSPEASDD